MFIRSAQRTHWNNLLPQIRLEKKCVAKQLAQEKLRCMEYARRMTGAQFVYISAHPPFCCIVWLNR